MCLLYDQMFVYVNNTYLISMYWSENIFYILEEMKNIGFTVLCYFHYYVPTLSLVWIEKYPKITSDNSMNQK